MTVGGKAGSPDGVEFKLLSMLMQRPGRVQARDRLLNEVWGYESAIDTRTVDTHVRRLREKLGKAADVIETVRGFGYRLRESVKRMGWFAFALCAVWRRSSCAGGGLERRGSRPGTSWRKWLSAIMARSGRRALSHWRQSRVRGLALALEKLPTVSASWKMRVDAGKRIQRARRSSARCPMAWSWRMVNVAFG